jgi:HEAT repeat protein
MKTIGAVAAAAVAVVGLNAWAGTPDPFEEVKPSTAVDTVKPILARVTATEIDGNDLAVDELLKIAASEEESLRLAAVEVLGEMASTRARAVLGVVLYSNGLPTVRAAAADQLGNFGDGESVFALALALEMEHDSEVRDVIAANLERNLPIEPEPIATPGRPEVAMADAG